MITARAVMVRGLLHAAVTVAFVSAGASAVLPACGGEEAPLAPVDAGLDAPVTSPPASDAAAADASAPPGPVVCRDDEVTCGGACTNLRSDPKNCGACGVACAANSVCNLGQCASSCEDGLTQCGQACVDTTSDARHCGACETACADTQTCSEGSCGCGAGLIACDGACGVACKSPSAVCNQGACAAGQTCKGGHCK